MREIILRLSDKEYNDYVLRGQSIYSKRMKKRITDEEYARWVFLLGEHYKDSVWVRVRVYAKVCLMSIFLGIRSLLPSNWKWSQMGRTIPSFRIASVIEKEEWRSFRKALDKGDRRIFDDMFDISILYNSASVYSAKYVRIHPIFMSIIFHHYKQLLRISEELDQIEGKNGSPDTQRWKLNHICEGLYVRWITGTSAHLGEKHPGNSGTKYNSGRRIQWDMNPAGRWVQLHLLL